MYVCVCVCARAHLCLRVFVCMHLFVCVRARARVRVCVCVRGGSVVSPGVGAERYVSLLHSFNPKVLIFFVVSVMRTAL
jgi:hypothetical protein